MGSNGMQDEGKVILETSMGNMVIELYWKHAPNTCRNFFELARKGYYNDVEFHKLIKDLVLQGGDPTGTGRGGSSIYGGFFEDEIHPELRHNGAGIVSMANSGPNTNGSQFMITLAPAHQLDGKYPIFGRLESGMQTLQKISLVATDSSDKPREPLKILRAHVSYE